MSVRLFLTRALASVGVLIATAILDTGSRASAAYISTASRSVGESSGMEAPAAELPTNPLQAERQHNERHLLTNQPTGAGGTSSSTNGPSGPNAPAAELPLKALPPGNLVVYFREPAVHLELSKYVDSILDPPR